MRLTRKIWNESQGASRVITPCLPKLGFGLPFLAQCEQHVHRDKDWEHPQRHQGWPFQRESEHDEHGAVVSQVTQPGVRTCRG